MATVRSTDKKVSAEILVVGLSRSHGSGKSGNQLHIESGDMTIDTRGLL